MPRDDGICVATWTAVDPLRAASFCLGPLHERRIQTSYIIASPVTPRGATSREDLRRDGLRLRGVRARQQRRDRLRHVAQDTVGVSLVSDLKRNGSCKTK